MADTPHTTEGRPGGAEDESSAPRRVVVVGLGLIGASLAGSLHRALPTVQVAGVDPDAHAREVCLERGWTSAALRPDEDGVKDAVMAADLVVLAVPASAARSYFDMLGAWGFAGTVTDTASTKRRVCADAEEALSDPSLFIPGHPMAGSEVNGVDGARDNLFEGAHWVLCPDERTDAERYAALHEMLTGIDARVVSLPRESHDEVVAVVSHVPHIVASSLVRLASDHAKSDENLFRLAAGGFKDSTRIAAGSPELWCGIAFDNRDAVVSGLDELRGIVGQFRDALAHGDRGRLTGLLRESAEARRAIPKRWAPESGRMMEVRVPMDNHPGAIAEVTAIASRSGCNIQSIEIDHLTAHSAVLDMALTDEGDLGRFSKDLLSSGYTMSISPLGGTDDE